MIKIICVGKLKEKYLKEALFEYQKRINKYNNIQIIELDDEDDKDINKGLLKERDRIIKNINPKDYIITLEIEGNELNSTQFAQKIDNIFLTNSNIDFIIGGSNGLHNGIKEMSNYSISFSKMTFPHQLFRIIVLEQIYRAFKIINNEKYHK